MNDTQLIRKILYLNWFPLWQMPILGVKSLLRTHSLSMFYSLYHPIV